MIIRCVNKIIRHNYNAYLALRLKLQYYWVDWLRMSSFYLLYALEYVFAWLLLLTSMP